ncbi:MAG: helix-turn-helix domain-containing protein [Chryseolinea sp.]
MKAAFFKPDVRIENYVERYLVIEHDHVNDLFTLPLFANGKPTLLFISAKGKIGNASAAYLTLFGQTVTPEILELTEDFTLIAYFFKPYALLSIFNVPPQELTDHPIDLNLLAPQKTSELQERLLNADTTEGKVALLDNYICYLISHANDNHTIVQYATTKIVQRPSKEVLVSLQKELHITERSFQRMFEKNIGLAPNAYRRICQFNAAFEQLNRRTFTKLSDLAFQNGYADQSHYIRSFKEFTNLTPKDYMNFGS